MSSRARRVAQGEPAPYDWGTGSAGALAPTPAAEPEQATGGMEDPGARHQAHLAALERDAFATGYAQGERAGVEAGNKRAEAMLRRLAATLEELGTLRQTMIRQSEQQMVELALAIARRILRREVMLDGDLILAMARVALDRLGEAASTTIRLNPEDCALALQRHGDNPLGSRVRIVADAAVSRGGCLVESEFGFIDAAVEAQFDQVMRALIGERGEVRHARPTAA
jgi:flagellar assembly protein FliH